MGELFAFPNVAATASNVENVIPLLLFEHPELQ
jgi:hypothetical protein